MNTVSDVLQAVGASIDQDTALPAGTELSVRVKFVDRSQKDWEEYYDWKNLIKPCTPSFSVSGTSIGLPQNFVQLKSPLYDYSSGIDTPTKYIEITPEERFSKLSTDPYIIVRGDDASGYSLTVNPPLSANASLFLEYKSHASALATINDSITCPSTQFLSLRTEYYILKARSDNRFPTVKGESDDMLAGMVEDEDTPSGGEQNETPNWMTRMNFRPGRD